MLFRSANAGRKIGVPGEDATGVISGIDFLRSVNMDETTKLNGRTIVIGGGNTAMDAARTAKRQPGVETVSIVYRRTKRYMPAGQEELTLALEEGILLRECLAPIRHEHNKLHCEIMQLGPSDVSGRRSPVATGAFISLDADTVIAAIGDQIDTAFFKHNHLPLTDRKSVV